MAKFNIEVNLDWLDEEENLDEKLKEEIISEVTSRVAQKTISGMETKINGIIQEQANKADKLVNEKLNTLLEDFLSRKRTITDRYGDVKQTDVSVMDMLKKACDDFIEAKVDERSGNVSSNGYNTIPRIQYLINTNIDYKMKSSIDSVAKQVRDGLQKYIDETLKAQIGENVAKIIGLESIKNRI